MGATRTPSVETARRWRVRILGVAAGECHRVGAALAEVPEFLVEDGGAAPPATLADWTGDLVLLSDEYIRAHSVLELQQLGSARVVVFTAGEAAGESVHWMRAGAADVFALTPENLASLRVRLHCILAAPPAGPSLRRRSAATEAGLEMRERRSQGFNRALAELAGNERLYRAESTTAFQIITETAARALGVARVSVWFFDEARTGLHCSDLFDLRAGTHTAGAVLQAADYPEYFTHLERKQEIVAVDAVRDPATRCFAETYLVPHGIGAMLDVPVRSADRVVGVVCHEHIGGMRGWVAAEQSFASAIASYVSLVLEMGARREAERELHAANDRLNEIIEFLPEATFVIDAEGVVTAWNRAMAELSRVPKAEIIGHSDFTYAVPFYGKRRPMLIDHALHPERHHQHPYEMLVATDGTIFGEAHVPHLHGGRGAYLWASARRLLDANGDVAGAIESIRDVTQRRHAENEIAAWKKRYELMAAVSGQITYEYDLADGSIIWSESVDKVLGYSLSKLGDTTLRWLRLVHGDDRRRVAAELHRCLRRHSHFESEYRMRHSDGSYRWFRDRAQHVETPNRSPCLVGMLTDITEAKRAAEELQRAHAELELRVRVRTAELGGANERLRAEMGERERAQQALAASEQKYRLMVDSLPQVVYEIDLQGNIVVLNREGIRTAGFLTDGDPHGVNIFSLVHPDDRARLRSNWEWLLAGGSFKSEEYRFLRRDGSSFPGCSYSHLLVRDGKPVGVTGFLVDETERRQAQEELRRAHAELEERVIQRTAELAASNDSLRRLLAQQEMNISLAHQVLLLVNAEQPRNTHLGDGLSLFTAAQSVPRYLAGGDHFFIRQLAQQGALRTLVSLKDQSGHEVGCILRSIITDLLHNALLGRPGAHPPLGEVVTALNREICRSHLFQDGDFFTALNLEIDHATLEMDYVVAGHPAFLLVRGTGVTLVPDIGGPGTNLPVGMLEHHVFRSASLQLQPGDRLLLYTDGLLEAPASRGDPRLSPDDLAALVRRIVEVDPRLHGVTLARRVFRELTGSCCKDAAVAHGLSDDVALVVVEVEGVRHCSEDCFRPANLAELHAARATVGAKILAEWSEHGISASPVRLNTVLEEALYNAWRHGNRGEGGKAIVVRRSYGNDACLEIIDEGEGFDWDRVADPTAHENRTKPSGRGLFMIRRFTDEARWSAGGRHLTMYFGDDKAFSAPGGRSPFPRLDLWKATQR